MRCRHAAADSCENFKLPSVGLLRPLFIRNPQLSVKVTASDRISEISRTLRLPANLRAGARAGGVTKRFLRPLGLFSQFWLWMQSRNKLHWFTARAVGSAARSAAPPARRQGDKPDQPFTARPGLCFVPPRSTPAAATRACGRSRAVPGHWPCCPRSSARSPAPPLRSAAPEADGGGDSNRVNQPGVDLTPSAVGKHFLSLPLKDNKQKKKKKRVL